MQTAVSSRGLISIGKYPNPDERLAAAIAAAQRAIKQSNIPEAEQHDMLDTLEKMASLANNVGGLARAFLDGFSQG